MMPAVGPAMTSLLIRGDENIYPCEIDEVLYQHPKVKDAATVGVAHKLYGEEANRSSCCVMERMRQKRNSSSFATSVGRFQVSEV